MTISGVRSESVGETISRLDDERGPPVAATGLDIIAELILDTALHDENATREASAARRDAAADLNRGRVAHLREAADWSLASGLASGIATIGASAAKAGSTAAAGAARSAPGASASEPPTSDGGWDAVGDGFDGAGKAASALFTWGANSANASAASEETRAEDALAHASEDRRDAESASSLHGRMLESMARSVDEKRRAEEAATRA